MLLPDTLIPSYPLQVAAGTLAFLLTARLVRNLLHAAQHKKSIAYKAH